MAVLKDICLRTPMKKSTSLKINCSKLFRKSKVNKLSKTSYIRFHKETNITTSKIIIFYKINTIIQP